MMVNTPQGQPEAVKPWSTIESRKITKAKQKAKQLKSAAWSKVLSFEGAEFDACQDFNYEVEVTGIVPIAEWLEAAAQPGELGRLAAIGAVEGSRGRMRVINKSTLWDTTLPPTAENMWKLPEDPNGGHLKAITNEHHFSKDVEAFMRMYKLPNIRLNCNYIQFTPCTFPVTAYRRFVHVIIN